jgi:hypothetical protein
MVGIVPQGENNLNDPDGWVDPTDGPLAELFEGMRLQY